MNAPDPTGVSHGPAAASPDELASLGAVIDAWGARESAEPNSVISSIEYIPEDRRWLVRMKGEERSIITVWLTLGQRTLHVETYFMPAPEENVEACWEYLLRINRRLFALRFAIGEEDAVYLLGQVPLRTETGPPGIDAGQLDSLIGAAYAYSEQYFRPAMSIGYASRFRR